MADADRILDAALALGESRGWDAVHLHEVAAAMGVPLAEIARHFDGKDALAEAWFDRADRALFAVATDAGEPRERLERVILAWLDALAPHRGLTRQMLGYKLQPEHLHLQLAGLLRISRTVQWLREAAALPAAGWRREVEEAALSAIFVASFAGWLFDDTPGQARTRSRLTALLDGAAFIARGPG